jgi:hypothetical protein
MGGAGAEHLHVEVLDPDGVVVASFASAIEAYRYAALIADPHFKPKLRRTSDGAIRPFRTQDRPSDLEEWGNH